MKIKENLKQRGIRTLLSLITVISIIFSLSACIFDTGTGVIHTKDEINAALTADGGAEREYSADYLLDWGVPRFDKNKFYRVEIIYKTLYVKELPEAVTLARGACELFLEHFYDEIDLTDKTSVTDALIACYVESIGDRYSFYRTAEEYAEYDTDMSGTFAGIGVTVQYNSLEDIMTVTSVSIGAGAHDAGILPGDIITKADGVSVKELGYQKTISAIRGKVGTRVKVTVDRDGTELTFDIERKQIVEETVTYSINDERIAYIVITDFKDNTYGQFKNAVDKAEEDGAVGIIYDLRGNPGGYLHSVVDMISYIVPKGTEIVSFSNGYGDPMKSNSDHDLSLPTVVICNEYTASAGELFTASMRDFGRGDGAFFESRIVGVKTFGKGVMQTTYPFSDKSAITLTVAYYNPPSGENYDGEGILPDHTVELTEDGDAQLDKAYDVMDELLGN